MRIPFEPLVYPPKIVDSEGVTSVLKHDAGDPNDLWGAGSRTAHLSGTQAVVRFLIDLLRADRARGLKTAAFVSGYQGSPLGGFDRELHGALKGLDIEIIHRPGVNEELGATAVMGSQVASTQESSTHDGVVGVWYGKGPGLDRSVDALRHATFAGTSPHGGVLVLVGDDPMAKSSTIPSASEVVLSELSMPVLFPRTLTEILELGQHAVAMSRYSGAPVGMKLVSVIADSEGTVSLAEPIVPVIPDDYVSPGASGDLLTPMTMAREPFVLVDRLAAAARYGDANGLNRFVVRPEAPVITLMAAGTVFTELHEALLLLGLGEAELSGLGVGLVELSMPFPLGEGLADELRVAGEDVVVVEERRELIENQVLSMLGRSGAGPRIWGRRRPDGAPFIPRAGALTAAALARILHPVLAERFGERVGSPPAVRIPLSIAASSPRTPWYCPGCPHSVSTAVPEGMSVGIGIGCHSIVRYMPEERTGRSIGLTQMGGEGAQWIGMSPFVGIDHVFQNIGDSTFFHSGHLALRAAVASGVSITYKVLWNGVSAMTGGQAVEGGTSVESLARMLLLEGARRVVITTDDVAKFRSVSLPDSVVVRPRDEILEVQRELAKVEGVTVLIHDQACATELRRARKRGLAPSPTFKVVINERVCEGCGDCQVKSNCLSLQTIQTPFGPKTRIDEDSCNVDLSCLEGDCPAFTLVKIDTRERRDPVPKYEAAMPIPDPVVRDLDTPISVRFAGIGGTGVVTVAHLLARAALIDGIEVWGVDQTGMSQKAGAVISDLRIGPGAAERSNILGTDEVDLFIVCDLLSATQPAVLDGASPARTSLVGSLAASLSGPMILGLRERTIDTGALVDALTSTVRPGHAVFLDTAAVAEEAGAATSTANVVLLGVASQSGLLPVSAGSLETAIEQNGVSVAANLAAFRQGRAWAAGIRPSEDPGASSTDDAEFAALTERFDLPERSRSILGRFAAELTAYQDRRLAERLLALCSEAWGAEEPIGGSGALTEAVAAGLFKLMAYKDEYEVARLLLDHPAAEGATTWLLHPPVLRARGLKRKIHLGGWARPSLVVLRASRRLRGRALDPFGHTSLRKTERALPDEYLAALGQIYGSLDGANLDEAIEIASLASTVRGYEGVKEHSIERYRAELARRLGDFTAR